MPSFTRFITEELKKTKENQRLRTLSDTIRMDGIHVQKGTKDYISFSCNDIFGLSQHEDVKQASILATEAFGTGSGASRLITGNHPLYDKLEQCLATMKKTEAALVFGSGYLANIGVIPTLMGKDDLIIADKLCHACMYDGAMLSGAKLVRFRHNDLTHCEDMLKKHRKQYRNCLILTETVFSMDGDRAPIQDLLQLADHYDSWLLSDDAHGLGITPAHPHPNHIQLGTLSKAAGAYGGYVCTSQIVRDYLINHARSFIFTTALPPSVLASACKALEIIQTDTALTDKAMANAALFTQLVGLPPAQSTIVPYIIGDEAKTLQASETLKTKGYLVSAIRPPTVPPNTSRLRFAFSALHTKEQITQLAKSVALLQEVL